MTIEQISGAPADVRAQIARAAAQRRGTVTEVPCMPGPDGVDDFLESATVDELTYALQVTGLGEAITVG